jgi:uncharacterized protein YndB with AHSA1/START domain
VWQAITDPAQIPHWWGPRGVTTRVEQMDLRPGGTWRFVMGDEARPEDTFYGEYREIVPPLRLVQTFEWGGMPGHYSVETMTLDEQHGQTVLRTHLRYLTPEDRDGILASGMEGGASETLDRLAELLAQG